MTADFHRTVARNKTISAMLILVFLSMTLFPQHFHMHHTADVTGHDSHSHAHVVDIHAHTGASDISHHNDGHIIESGADMSFKTPGLQLPWIAVLVLFSLLLPVFSRANGWHPPDESRRLRRFNRHSIPPLRAPPRI
ncbi:MAG: hypothetical protein RQ736_14215 [Thiogranum sp.]|nr:hypothetical protein [Thiogranum sp.]